MDDKYLILSIAKTEIEKKLEKSEKKAQEKSSKLQQHASFKGTKNKGVRLRINAELAAEERDRWSKRLELSGLKKGGMNPWRLNK